MPTSQSNPSYAGATALLVLTALCAEPIFAQDGAFDFGGNDTVKRTEEHTFPLGERPVVAISNRFGNVAVESWSNPLVRMVATVTAGSDDRESAERLAQLIEIEILDENERLDLNTYAPGEAPAGVGYTVDYFVQVPATASVNIENIFGDVSITGLSGEVGVDSRYGVIDLSDLGGPVTVRARGEFPLRARGLRADSHFTLRGTKATFRDIAGNLLVNNYLGFVQLYEYHGSNAEIATDSGEIHFHLGKGPRPNIEMRADFGRIESELALERDAWGSSQLATLPSLDARQHVHLQTTFDNIYLHDLPKVNPSAVEADSARKVQMELTERYPLRPGQSVRIDATRGDVTVLGTDESDVTVTASRRARVDDPAKARLTLEGLALRVQHEGPALRIVTLVQEDMQALGATDYAVDLVIRCPRGSGVQVFADHGRAHVADLDGSVEVEVGRGEIAAELLSGSAHLINHNGGIGVENITGPVSLRAHDGDARLYNARANIVAEVENGRTVVDTPGAGLRIRAANGDVRVIALEGIRGDYDIAAESGHVSLAAPDTASATFWLNATDGTVQSAIPVTGTMEKAAYRFQGRLNDGRHRVLLETRGGDIQVD